MLLSSFSFVADGYWRARTAAEQEIPLRVEGEYAERLAAAANSSERSRIREAINHEIKRRVDQVAPRHGLY